MGKSAKDACGGHNDRDLARLMPNGVMVEGWTPEWKRHHKDRSNRMLRREAKLITAQAVAEYEFDIMADKAMMVELDEYNDMYVYHGIDHDEYDREYAEDMAALYEREQALIDEMERREFKRDYFDDWDPYYADDRVYFGPVKTFVNDGQESTYYGA